MASYLVRYEFPSGLAYNFKMDGNTYLTPHFRLFEVANTKGIITLPMYVFNEKTWELMNCMEEFRVWFGEPINPTSGFRQIKFNLKAGGDARSLHLLGLAIDWKWQGTEARRKEIEEQWKIITMRHGLIGGCNWYTHGFHFSIYEDERFGYKNFVHRDFRGTKDDW